MRLLITGGLGFIGSNFVRHILKETDWNVINLDKQTYSGNPENLKEFEENPRYRWVKGDIIDPGVVLPLMEKTDIVVHFAAESHVDRSIEDAQVFLKTNILGTQTLLEAARLNKIRIFLHVSTDEVYGSVATGSSTETDSLLPNSPYASSKASSDLLVRSYIITYGLPAIISRCSNNFGPYQFPEKAIPLLITNALQDEPFPLYGDGRHVRDWIYVSDHVRALMFLIAKGTPGEIYNIGGTCSLSNKELVFKTLSLMEKPKTLVRSVHDRPGHDRRYALDCRKMKSLGWAPQTNFEEALQQTVDWYRSHREWWMAIKQKKDFKEYYKQQYAARLAASQSVVPL